MGHGHRGPFGRHGPPPWLFAMMGGAPRAEKGEVRYMILDAIKDQPRHGYDIIQTIEQRSNGHYRPSPGTIYPTLQMLEEMGHVESQQQGKRTVYEITDEGRADLDAHQDEVDEAYDRMRSPFDWAEEVDFREFGAWARRLTRNLKRAFRSGHLGPDEFRQIAKVLDETAAKIEKIVTRR